MERDQIQMSSLWHCSRYPVRTPLGCPGGDQLRVISVSDGLSSIRFMGGPGTNNNINKQCLKCIWLQSHFYTIQSISFPVFLTLTSLVGFEGQWLRVGSLSLAVEHFDAQDIVGVRSEITDHLFILTGPSLYYHSTFWLRSPTPPMVFPGAKPGQVDLDPQNQSEKGWERKWYYFLCMYHDCVELHNHSCGGIKTRFSKGSLKRITYGLSV